VRFDLDLDEPVIVPTKHGSEKSTMRHPLALAQIGLGHWGPNLFRYFREHRAVDVKMVSDVSAAKLEKVRDTGVATTTNPCKVLQPDNGIDAVVIGTPVCTHHALAKEALLAGKHVFVEKPLASSVRACEELVSLARDTSRILMVGHVFLYHAGIRYVKQLIDSGDLGKVLFVHSQRTNLGPVRQDVNALWDLVSHDISIFNFWLGKEPGAACATGSRILNDSIEDVVTANFFYDNDLCCQALGSWLHPSKVRQITVVGEHKMVVWDDMSATEPVRVYDKSIVHAEPREQVEGTLEEFNVLIREGDLVIPRIPGHPPLKAECDHFVECILENQKPLTDGENGLAVVRALETASASMREQGRRVLR
jgi:predicted dehydrogenase